MIYWENNTFNLDKNISIHVTTIFRIFCKNNILLMFCKTNESNHQYKFGVGSILRKLYIKFQIFSFKIFCRLIKLLVICG